MPAVSKAQQRFMGMVHAAQKGEEPASPEVAKVAKDMDKADAKDFASTKHKGLPMKKETITRARLKELVKEVMKEESEYQAFFKKELEKAGKSISQMSDDEKKEFFNKIDSEYKGKTESVSTELPKATIPTSVNQKLKLAVDKIKDAKLSNVQKLQLVAQVIDALGVDKSQLGQITTKIRSKMESK
jgi:hypothetical protein